MTTPDEQSRLERAPSGPAVMRGGWRSVVLVLVCVLALAPLVRAVNPPAVSVRLLGGTWSPPAGDAAPDVPKYRPGQGMRLRLTADRDGQLYVFRWRADAAMTLLELDGQATHRTHGWTSSTLPAPEAAPLVVADPPGIGVLVVLNCPAALEPAALDRLAQLGMHLRPGTSELSVMDVRPVAASSGCAAFAAGYQVVPAS